MNMEYDLIPLGNYQREKQTLYIYLRFLPLFLFIVPVEGSSGDEAVAHFPSHYRHEWNLRLLRSAYSRGVDLGHEQQNLLLYDDFLRRQHVGSPREYTNTCWSMHATPVVCDNGSNLQLLSSHSSWSPRVPSRSTSTTFPYGRSCNQAECPPPPNYSKLSITNWSFRRQWTWIRILLNNFSLLRIDNNLRVCFM